MVKKLVTLLMDKEEYEKYKQFCNANGFNVSKRLRFLIKQDMEGENNAN